MLRTWLWRSWAATFPFRSDFSKWEEGVGVCKFCGILCERLEHGPFLCPQSWSKCPVGSEGQPQHTHLRMPKILPVGAPHSETWSCVLWNEHWSYWFGVQSKLSSYTLFSFCPLTYQVLPDLWNPTSQVLKKACVLRNGFYYLGVARPTDGNVHHCRGGLFLLSPGKRAHHVTTWLWSESGLGVYRFVLSYSRMK